MKNFIAFAKAAIFVIIALLAVTPIGMSFYYTANAHHMLAVSETLFAVIILISAAAVIAILT